jgi:hypothetical protein
MWIERAHAGAKYVRASTSHNLPNRYARQAKTADDFLNRHTLAR